MKSIWKGVFIANFFLRKKRKQLRARKINTRNSTILPHFLVNIKVWVYNGQFFFYLFLLNLRWWDINLENFLLLNILGYKIHFTKFK